MVAQTHIFPECSFLAVWIIATLRSRESRRQAVKDLKLLQLLPKTLLFSKLKCDTLRKCDVHTLMKLESGTTTGLEDRMVVQGLTPQT